MSIFACKSLQNTAQLQLRPSWFTPLELAVGIFQSIICVACLQGSQLVLSVNKYANPGEVVPPLEFDLSRELPDITAARMARKYVHNMHPEVGLGCVQAARG